MKRTISFALACLLLAGTLSCGGESGTTDTTSESDTTPAETTADSLALTVEKADFGGYTVNYLTVDLYSEHFNICIETENGDTLNDAGYKREQAVSELLNVNFSSHEVATIDDVTPALNAAVMANTNEFDYVLPHAHKGLNGVASEGLLLDLHKLEDVNFEAPWWNQSIQENLNINGKCYLLSGDMFITWQGMMVWLFNKDLQKDLNIDEDLYDLVWDGKWTVDKLMSLSKGVYSDLDGDTVVSANDRYGILYNVGEQSAFMYACDQRVTEFNDEGIPELNLGTERMITITEKYYDLIWSPDTWRETAYSTTYASSSYREILVGGRSLFTYFDLGGLYGDLRTFEFDFGILPLPMLDENQDGYKVFCGGGLLGVPSDCSNLERTGKVLEALGYYSYEYMRPAYFDVVLENKVLRDEDSYNIIEMMHESKTFDFGYNYYTAAPQALHKVVVSNKSTDFSSYYATIEDGLNQQFRDVFEKIASFD